MINEIAVFGPIAAWLLNFFCFSSALILIALCVDQLVPEGWGIHRECVWKLIVPISLLGATALLSPTLSDNGSVTKPMPATVLQPAVAAELPAIKPSSTTVGQEHSVSTAPATPTSTDLSTILWSLYCLAMLWGLGRLGRDFLAARTLQRDATVLADEEVLQHARALAKQAGVATPVVKESPSLSGPITFIDNTICLPPWAIQTLNEQQLRSMLAHEIAHLARRDVLWTMALRALRCLLPIQPLLALVQRRTAYYAELACDDWAAAVTGKPMALAQTLGQCAAKLVRPHNQALAAGMADSQLVARVRRLTAGHLQQPKFAARTAAMMLSVSLAVLMMVPGVAISSSESYGRTVEVVEDDSGRQRGSMRIRNDERKLSFKYEGTIGFTATFDDVASLDEDGLFRLSDDMGGVRRKVELEFDEDGSLKRNYKVNGRRADWDDNAKVWFAGIIQLLLRETGMALEQRMDYLMSINGPDTVIDEVNLIRSDYVMRRYVVALSAMAQLEQKQLKRLLKIMEADLQSDYEQRTALTSLWVDQANITEVTPDLLAAAATVESDYEARTLAETVAQTMPLDEASMQRWLNVVDDIQSDFEMRTALTSLLERDGLSGTANQQAVIDLLQSSHDIQSDFEHRSFLVAAADLASLAEATGLAYAQACAEVQSDFEMREAIMPLLEAGPPSDKVWLALLDLVRTDISGHEAAEVLIAMASRLPASPDLQSAFDRAKDKLRGSDKDRVNRAVTLQ